jgi:hypothetical protein
VSDEPSNAASEYLRLSVSVLGEFLPPSEIRLSLTDDFVAEDRRRGPTFPVMGADEYPQSFATIWDTNVGRPRFTLHEILAVRGERLAAGRLEIDYGNGWTIESIQLLELDATLTLVQRTTSFDVDDVDGAIAELDRLDSESDTR